MITLMTYIGGWQCNHVSVPPPFHPRERQSMRMLTKRTTNFVFEYRFVWLLTVELFVGAKHEKSHITLDYRVYVRPESLTYFTLNFFYINVPWKFKCMTDLYYILWKLYFCTRNRGIFFLIRCHCIYYTDIYVVHIYYICTICICICYMLFSPFYFWN